jgi:DHA1 family multidrug resistance protein-like MFS transporter
MYTVYAIVYAALQVPIVALVLKKFSPRQSVVAGIAVIAGALLLTAFAATTLPFIALVAVYALGMLLARPNQQNIAVSMAEPRALGMYLGVNSLAFAIGKGFGTILGGAAFDLAKKAETETLPWYLFTALALVSMFGFMLCKRIGQPRAATDRQE